MAVTVAIAILVHELTEHRADCIDSLCKVRADAGLEHVADGGPRYDSSHVCDTDIHKAPGSSL